MLFSMSNYHLVYWKGATRVNVLEELRRKEELGLKQSGGRTPWIPTRIGGGWGPGPLPAISLVGIKRPEGLYWR